MMFACVLFALVPVVPGGERTVIDQEGRTVTLPDRPRRIISLAPNITETLFAIGLDGEIAGVTSFCNYPLNDKQRVGGMTNPSLERIVSLEPDLIIATADGNRKETVVLLENMKYPVYVVNPQTINDILDMVLRLGVITGRKSEAVDLVRSMQTRTERVVAQAAGLPKKRVFFQIGSGTLITAGRDTFLNELITLAGGVNIAGDIPIRYPRFTMEELAAARPDYVIVVSMKKGETIEDVKRQWARRQGSDAVDLDTLRLVDADLVSRPAPRIVEGLETLFAVIHNQ